MVEGAAARPLADKLACAAPQADSPSPCALRSICSRVAAMASPARARSAPHRPSKERGRCERHSVARRSRIAFPHATARIPEAAEPAQRQTDERRSDHHSRPTTGWNQSHGPSGSQPNPPHPPKPKPNPNPPPHPKNDTYAGDQNGR